MSNQVPPSPQVIKVEGLIGETSDFFKIPTKNLTNLYLDMEKATYMNSVGVKHWITWTNKVPSTVSVVLGKCPYMIANQASMVIGFLPKNFSIESFFAPFICPDCEIEKMELLKRGEHYEFASTGSEHWVKLPTLHCAKCASKPELDPDFFQDKLFAFLKVR